MRAALLSLVIFLTGCASTASRDAAAEARGYERGYAQAVKEQYWIIQNQQRTPSQTPKPTTP